MWKGLKATERVHGDDGHIKERLVLGYTCPETRERKADRDRDREGRGMGKRRRGWERRMRLCGNSYALNAAALVGRASFLNTLLRRAIASSVGQHIKYLASCSHSTLKELTQTATTPVLARRPSCRMHKERNQTRTSAVKCRTWRRRSGRETATTFTREMYIEEMY